MSDETAMQGTVIHCEGLAKTYAEGTLHTPVFDGLDFSVRAGETVAILGASGAGKSTLLHLLGGLDTPTAGEVYVAGQKMSALSDAERGRLRNRALGFVYQFHHLLPEFTAEENVAFPHRIAGVPSGEARRLASELLDRVGLADRRSHLSRSLSGGEQQRVAIARALARRPRLLLADEPTGNLDAESARVVFDLLAELHYERRMTTVLVTHNPELAKRCDKIFAMSREGILPATGFPG